MNHYLSRFSFRNNKYTCISKRFQYNLIEAINILCTHRHAERNFSSKQISKDILFKILSLAQLAPSSFNLQPYKLIIIQSNDIKEMLSTAMLGRNTKTVISAPVTIVVLADQDPLQNLNKLMKLELENGTDPNYVSSLPSKLNLLLDNHSFLSRNIRNAVFHLLSPIQPTPKLSYRNHSWAIKNTMLMTQQLMLAATAYGIHTGPMEGYDERRVGYILNIPKEKYSIPIIINLGYSIDPDDKLFKYIKENDNGDDNNKHNIHNLPRKIRFPLEDICYSEKYGERFVF